MSLLPSNTSKLMKVLEQIADERLSILKDNWSVYYNPETCPQELLPYLAWYVQVFLWDSDWNVEKKRKVIKNTIEIRTRRGTQYAIQSGLNALEVDADVLPWWANNDADTSTDKDFLALAVVNENLDGGIPRINAKKEALIRDICESLKPMSATFETRFCVKFTNEVECIANLRVYPMFNAFMEIDVSNL